MIYSVEDDPSIRELVVYALRQSGFEAEGFQDGAAFGQALQKRLPDLVLLDQMLPGMDGETLLKRMRADARTRRVPVIMLTAKGGEMDKVTALDNGADDYIVKPFSVMELLSRVRAVLRRAAPEDEPRLLKMGTVEMDVGRHTVQSDGEAVQLTNREFELLRFLMENPGLVFSREKLLNRVWDMAYAGDTRTVDAHVRFLRQKLGSNAALIETVRGVGYKATEGGASQ